MNIFIITKLPQKIVVKESLRRGFGVLENSSLPSTSFNGPYLAQNDAIAIIAIFGSIILMSIFACIFICCHKQSRANVSESHDKKKNITITLSQPAGHQFEPVNNTILDDEDGGGWHGKRRSESFQLRGSSEDKANRRHGFKAYKNLNSPDFGVEIPGSDSNLSSCQQSHAANSPDKIGLYANGTGVTARDDASSASFSTSSNIGMEIEVDSTPSPRTHRTFKDDELLRKLDAVLAMVETADRLYNTSGGSSSSLSSQAQAKRLYFESVYILSLTLGASNVDVIATTVKLADVYYCEKDYESAEMLYIYCFDAYKKNLGPENINTISTMLALALLYESRGSYKLAENLFTECLDIQTRVLGTNHRETLITTNYLAEFYISQKRNDLAESYYKICHSISSSIYGPDHHDCEYFSSALKDLSQKQ